MKLSEFFAKDNIVPELAAAGKDEAIHEMVKQVCGNGSIPKNQSAEVEKALLRREELGTTGIGKGVAVPHAKVKGVKGIIGVLGRSITGVSFDALDGQPVHLVFMIISAPDTMEPYTEALRKVMALLKEDDYCAFLRRAKDQSEISDLLREVEERLK